MKELRGRYARKKPVVNHISTLRAWKEVGPKERVGFTDRTAATRAYKRTGRGGVSHGEREAQARN